MTYTVELKCCTVGTEVKTVYMSVEADSEMDAKILARSYAYTAGITVLEAKVYDPFLLSRFPLES